MGKLPYREQMLISLGIMSFAGIPRAYEKVPQVFLDPESLARLEAEREKMQKNPYKIHAENPYKGPKVVNLKTGD